MSEQHEVIKKVSELLNEFNNSFELQVKVIEKNNEDGTVELSISGLKNDGSDFIRVIHETFSSIIALASENHDVMYIDGKGLTVAKKVIKKVEKVEYLIEDFD